MCSFLCIFFQKKIVFLLSKKNNFFLKNFFLKFFFTQFYLKSTQFYHILLSFTSSGTQFYQIPLGEGEGAAFWSRDCLLHAPHGPHHVTKAVLRVAGRRAEVGPSTPNPVSQVVLKPGSCFYFPAGMWHRVECEEDSVSINVSLKAPCWGDVVSSALRQLLWQDDAWRASICAAGPDEARDKLEGLLGGLKRKVEALTVDALLPRQMMQAYAANEAQAWLDRVVRGGAENGEVRGKGDEDEDEDEEEEEEEEEEMDMEDVDVEVEGRTRGGPGFGGVRKLVLLAKNRSRAEEEGIERLSQRLGRACAFRKNSLAVLVSAKEVAGLGEDEMPDGFHGDVYALHVNFGNDDATSLHRTLIFDGGKHVTSILKRVVAGDCFQGSRLDDGTFRASIELCYAGFLIGTP